MHSFKNGIQQYKGLKTLYKNKKCIYLLRLCSEEVAAVAVVNNLLVQMKVQYKYSY